MDIEQTAMNIMAEAGLEIANYALVSFEQAEDRLSELDQSNPNVIELLKANEEAIKDCKKMIAGYKSHLVFEDG